MDVRPHLERPRLISYTLKLILGARDKGFPQSNSPQVTILASPVVSGKLWFDGKHSNPELPLKRMTENPNRNVALECHLHLIQYGYRQ